MGGRANKSKGHHAERYYADLFRKLGFTFCKTSRLASRMLDNCKIDLAFLPFNVQVKAGKQEGLNVHKVFSLMKELVKEKFPPTENVHAKPYILIHRPSPYSKNEDKDDIYVTLEQFNHWKVRNPKLDYRDLKTNHKYDPEFKELVVMPFSVFKSEIIPLYL
jgi:hypothetical protein